MTTRDDEMFEAGSGFAESERCAWVRDRLPLHQLGILSEFEGAEVDAHVSECDECRTEARVVAHLQAHAPEPPASILAGVRERRDRGVGTAGASEWRKWAMRSAAVVMLALGVSVVWSQEQAPDPAWAMALEPDAPSGYGSEWVVAGQPVPEALPDDVLREFIEEIEQ